MMRSVSSPSWRFGLVAFVATVFVHSLSLVCLGVQPEPGQSSTPYVDFDFRTSDVAKRWHAQHDLAPLSSVSEGVELEIQGNDPYMFGPSSDFPEAVPLLLRIRLKSDEAGTAQLFYFQQNTREEDSVRFAVQGGDWQEIEVPLPPLASKTRLRFDPPGTSGKVIVQRLTFLHRTIFESPQWLPPTELAAADFLELANDRLRFKHDGKRWSSFWLEANHGTILRSHNQPLLGYLSGDAPTWIDLSKASGVSVQKQGDEVHSELSIVDSEGATWKLHQAFYIEGESLRFRCQASCDQDRHAIFVPLLLVNPGFESEGDNKFQSLLPGLEYLENEPSSSTADVEGPASLRRVPNPTKITFPLAVLSQAPGWISMDWEMNDSTALLFDSPDRVMKSSRHLWGLIAPGATPQDRIDGELLPFRGKLMKANEPVVVEGKFVIGEGLGVTAAVRSYVQRRGLPERLPTKSLQEYAALTAAGWLKTPIRDEMNFQHAVGVGFRAHPALDAAKSMQRLAPLVADGKVTEQLERIGGEAATVVPLAASYQSHIGHLKIPDGSMEPQRVLPAMEAARQLARRMLDQFPASSIGAYAAPPIREGDGLRQDLGRTHYARGSNGLAGERVATMLDAALFAGDPGIIAESLERLRSLNRFDGTVPRGAQTWEVPLHTPDILASAHMVRAYTTGYEVTGDPEMLRRAIQWGWSGVPFVYLRDPVAGEGKVGRFSTIAVYGATQYVAPVWMGLPVQWCGLVYAKALRQLQGHDPQGPWKELSDGIITSAMDQLYPLGDKHQGLLPDSFQLSLQIRSPADINPATLQPLAIELLGGGASYQRKIMAGGSIIVHSAGDVEVVNESQEEVAVRLKPWFDSTAIIHGVKRESRVIIDGKQVEAGEAALQWIDQSESLLIQGLPRDRVTEVTLSKR